jgi:DNA polymerase-3 subunit gamma/tau
VALAAQKRDMRLKIALESEVRLVRFEPGLIEFELAPGGARDLASTLMQKLQAWTGERWMVSIVAAGGAPTLKEQREAEERKRRSSLESDPLVASVLARFPGAQIVAVRGRDEGAASAETLYDDASPIEEDDGEAQ